MRLLILGGTTEASSLARLLAGDPRFEATLSLAGRTSRPAPQPLPMRIGGFGGIDGLVRYLTHNGVDAVVDATHPYADQMSVHAVAACRQTGAHLVSLVRAPWTRAQGDVWVGVGSTGEAVHALGSAPRRVFLGIGRQELHVFANAPQHHYLARVIEPPPRESLPPAVTLIRARGPFDLAAETSLLCDGRIDVVVAKNAGGKATYAKIEAARALGLPVIMIGRPDKPAGHVVTSAEAAIAWLAHAPSPRSPRGV